MQRIREPELMDDPSLDAELHIDALDFLESVNAMGGTARLLWKAIKPIYQHQSTVRVLDIATGSGSVPIALHKIARLEGFDLQVSGCDLSSRAVKCCAERAAKEGVPAEFFVLDAVCGEIPTTFDVIVSTNFTHHIDPPQVVGLLENCSRAAKRAVFIIDVERSALNYAIMVAATRILTNSPVVQYDGPVSVKAAYTSAEWQQMAARAGLSNCEIERVFPFRLQLAWHRR